MLNTKSLRGSSDMSCMVGVTLGITCAYITLTVLASMGYKGTAVGYASIVYFIVWFFTTVGLELLRQGGSDDE